MKKITALVDSMPIILNIPETLSEFREGARLSELGLQPNEGYLFQFGKFERLSFENSNVREDLSLLFFHDFVGTAAVIEEVKQLKSLSAEIVTSDGMYGAAVELPLDFCQANRIGKGSILTLQEDLEEFRSLSPEENSDQSNQLRLKLQSDRETLEHRQKELETSLFEKFTAWDVLQRQAPDSKAMRPEKDAVLGEMREILSNRTYVQNILNDLVETIG